MKDQVLNIEQIQELIDLGFDVEKYASMCWLDSKLLPKEDGFVKCFCELPIPTLTIGDIINILPEVILASREDDTLFKYAILETDMKSYLRYICFGHTIIEIKRNEKFINMLFDLLKWCIENDCIKKNSMNTNNYGFTLTPCHIPFCAKKDQAKADIATKYIGFGIKGTSTYRYGGDAINQDIPVNAATYSYKDVVYVSINGGNNFRQDNFDNTVECAINALNAGATIVCDNDNQRNKPYNSVGEGRFYKELCQHFGDALEELTNPLFSTFKLKI